MPFPPRIPLIIAQAIAEHGLLDAMAAGVAGAKYRLEVYIGQGNTVYVLVAAAVVLALIFFRRRR